MNTRPVFQIADDAPMAAMFREAAERKTVYVNLDGEAFWLNSQAQAEAIAAKNGGSVYPPKA